ncbi:MAG: ThiF family adenylyltransferase [Methylocystis sp.]
MITAAQENARMLASILGIEEDDASERLNRRVLITSSPDKAEAAWAAEIGALLGRTVSLATSHTEPSQLELVIGDAAPRTALPRLHASIDADGATVAFRPTVSVPSPPHPLFAAVAACPVAAAALRMVIDDPRLPPVTYPLTIDFAQLGVPAHALSTTVDLSDAVLVGAGAIGHGFVRALRHVPARGRLRILDPKLVGAGNPNRCLYLENEDVGREKAVALAERAAGDFGELVIEPLIMEFSKFAKKSGPPATAIVAVDSRRARRSIQKELPGRIIDASTTDVRRVVVHSHRQPTQHACLACIYKHVPDEHAREQSIADGLGIELEAVKEGYISAQVAARIHVAHRDVDPERIVGSAYDSLFKQLCAAQALLTPEGRQVLAPFAFVSSLAGALLVIELLRSNNSVASSNYWSVDPWGAPIGKLRRLRPRDPECEFCTRLESDTAAKQLWGS